MDLEMENDNDATDAEYVPDKEDMLDDEFDNRRRPTVQFDNVWEHFEKVSDTEATCNYCLKRLSYRTNVNNLKQHLKVLHSDIEFEDPSEKKRNYIEIESNELPSNNDVWNHYLYISRGKARCKYCREVRLYQTSLTNLKTHLQNKHYDIVRNKESDRKLSTEEKQSELQKRLCSSFVWKHFQYLTRSVARCNYCHKLRSFKTTITNLKKHLEYLHPEILAQEENYKFESDETDSQSTSKSKQDHESVSKNIIDFYNIRVSVEGSKVATCKVCAEDMEFKLVSQLKFHMEQRHADIDIEEDKSSDEEKEVSESRNKRKSSKTWRVFKVVDPVARIAYCTFCGKNISYVSKSNLTKHIVRRHEKVHPSSDRAGALKKKKRLGSLSWKYFTVSDPVAKVATCKYCQKDLSYMTSVSNLMKHVVKTHMDAVFGSTSSDDDAKRDVTRDSVTPEARKPSIQRQFRSATWKHFSVVDPVAKLAKCNLCRQNFSFVSLSNLKKHLVRRHQGIGESSDEEDVEVVAESPIWAYFKCLDETLKIASCLICKMRVEYNEEKYLHRHLKRKHPYVNLEELKNKAKKLMITGNGDIYEIDDSNIHLTKQEPEWDDKEENDNGNDSEGWQDNEEGDALNMTETAYLDETIFDEPEYTPPKKKRNTQSVLNPLHTTEDSSLDIFGKYMVSLLKKLPKNKADRLQVDFVRQIMEAQQDYQNQHNKSQKLNTRYKSQVQYNDDTSVTSNSDLQRVISTRNEEQLSPPSVTGK